MITPFSSSSLGYNVTGTLHYHQPSDIKCKHVNLLTLHRTCVLNVKQHLIAIMRKFDQSVS